jgi:Ni/Co efflux regulator RcnB
MKKLVSAVALVLLVGGGMAFSQGQGGAQDKPDAQKRIELLEQDLGAQKQKCEALTADLEATKTLLTKTLDYLEAQSKSASTMAATLDEAERLGFTWGINPDSRTTLLRGWREQLTAAQQAVPTPPAPKADTPKSGAKK